VETVPVPPENLKLAALGRRDLLDQLLNEAGNPDPDTVPLRPVGRCITDYDPLDDSAQDRERFVPYADPGDAKRWKSHLARLNAWAVQTADLLGKYDKSIARHFESLRDEVPVGCNAQQQFCKLSLEHYRPTLEALVSDPLSLGKRFLDDADPVGPSAPQPLVQNFHGAVGSVQSGAGSAANVLQPAPVPVQQVRAEESVGTATPMDRFPWASADALLRVEFRLPTIYLGGGTCTVGVWVWTVQEVPRGVHVVESGLKVLLDGVPLSHVALERDPIPLTAVGKTDMGTRIVKLDRDLSQFTEIMMSGELLLTLDVPGEQKDVRVRLSSEQLLCRVKGR
jgi:hypothetical protein